MLIYILTGFTLYLFGTIDIILKIKPIVFNFLYFIISIILILQVGLRWETGTDWNPYLDHFNNSTSINLVLINVVSGFDIGYSFIAFLFRSIFENYTLFLLFNSILFYTLVLIGNKRYSPYPFISLLFFYALTIGILGSNRQLLAISICVYSLKYLISKKNFKFLLCVLVASTFHSTAILFLFFFFFNKDYNKYTLIILLLSAVVIGYTTIPNFIFSKIGGSFGDIYSNKVDYYNSKNITETESLSFVGLFKRITLLIIFMINYNRISISYKYYKIFFNAFYFGLLFYFLFGHSLLILVNRGSLYFNIMECFLIAYQLTIFKSKQDKILVFQLLFIYSFFVFSQSISSYKDLFIPYKGIFINQDYNRYIY